MEIWKAIPGFSICSCIQNTAGSFIYKGGYEASSDGRIRSLNYKLCKGRVEIMKPGLSPSSKSKSKSKLTPYLSTILTSDDGEPKHMTVHKLVALAFLGGRL